MKLKKIASLALAGIMAVSMLAGCKNGGSSSSSSSENTTPATGVSATFASYLTDKETVTFTDGNNGDLMVKATNKVDDSAIDAVYTTTGVTQLSSGDPFATIHGTIVNGGKITDVTKNGVKDHVKSDASYIAVYTASGNMDQKYVLAQVAKALNTKLSSETLPENSIYTTSTKPGDTYYTYDYTGTIDMVKTETKDGDASAWCVLVVLNIDATSAKMPEA